MTFLHLYSLSSSHCRRRRRRRIFLCLRRRDGEDFEGGDDLLHHLEKYVGVYPPLKYHEKGSRGLFEVKRVWWCTGAMWNTERKQGV